MMQNEFEALTGIYPDADLYEEIEEAYIEMDVDKATFCARYKANEDGLAQKIQSRMNYKRFEERASTEKRISNLEEDLRIERSRLEAVLEWKPYTVKSAITQTEYDELTDTGHAMTERRTS